jgi:acetyl-CoA carboxylase carboxyltransferase component
VRVAIRAGTRGCVTARVDDIGGRPAVVVEIDPTDRKGALSSDDGESIAIAAHIALAERIPLVGYIASSGADIVEGMAALHGWGLAARALADCSGIVPVVLAVTGPAVSGPALLLGLADLVVMTADSYAFVSGPTMVTEFTGVRIDSNELGGAHVHARHTGAASIVVDDVEAAEAMIELLLAFLPAHADEAPPRWPTDDPADRLTPEAGDLLPDASTGSYDVRSVIEAIVDDGDLVELRARWAPNLVTGFATIAGQPVGIVANQPLAIAGTLDIPSSQKGARFVGFCDAFNLPIITLVDTSGFYPGKDLEWRGMIRHGAQLAFAYARATVPRICIILRKSYGGAYIVMDSKKMGNDLCLAWPTAELAVMGAKGAIEILHRRATPEERAPLEADYEARMLNPFVAAERGYVDAVIEPRDTRAEIAHALVMLDSKQESLVGRKHDNSPL